MKNKLIKSIPNIITFTRLISVIMGFILIFQGYIKIGIILYVYGAISDMLDGYFARKLNAYTKFGSYLDAISDKIYFFSVMIISIVYSNFLIIIPAILEFIITCINTIILVKRKKSYTERVGKHKMTTEFVMIIVFLISIKYKSVFYIAIILLILTIYLQIQTIISYINQLNGKTKESKIVFKSTKLNYKIKYLLKEYLHYLIKPVRIIK